MSPPKDEVCARCGRDLPTLYARRDFCGRIEFTCLKCWKRLELGESDNGERTDQSAKRPGA